MTSPFEIVAGSGKQLPIIISCPHVGTLIPDDIKATMVPEVADRIEDTDWYIHELYNFAPAMGMTLIKANFSRYVIDLNRDPSGKALYSDSRRQTALVPTTTFSGKEIYRSKTVSPDEVEFRRKIYFEPYHAAVDKLISEKRKVNPNVLFFDAHSIKRRVASIRPEPFPDMIIGDNKGTTAAPPLSNAALSALRAGANLQVAHNDPFMGGWLTRKQGRPAEGIHAIQLEMAQDLYMNEHDDSRNSEKQVEIATVLTQMFLELAKTLEALNA